MLVTLDLFVIQVYLSNFTELFYGADEHEWHQKSDGLNNQFSWMMDFLVDS